MKPKFSSEMQSLCFCVWDMIALNFIRMKDDCQEKGKWSTYESENLRIVLIVF